VRRRKGLRLWQTLAIVSLGSFSLHAGLGVGGQALDSFFNRWFYSGLLLLACVALIARGLLVRAERSAWLLFAAGVTFWTTGDIYYSFAFAKVASPPVPSLADAFYIGFYPCAYGALMLLVRSRASDLQRGVWLDGALAALAAASASAAVLFGVVLDNTHGTPALVITNLAYPLGDILLLAFAVGILALGGWRPGRLWALIAGGLLLLSLADGTYLYQSALGLYHQGTLLDTAWPAGLLLVAKAAWEPPPPPTPISLEDKQLLITPAVCGLVALAVLGYDHFTRVNALAFALALATLLALTIRAGLTFQEKRQQALTDALTGLNNRRSLLADLSRALSNARRHQRWLLLLFDLDGFKAYNDRFGHPAGDALLARLARRLADAVGPAGTAYRLGGDEFCLLAHISVDQAGSIIDRASGALVEDGEGFRIGNSFGAAFLPDEADDASAALRIADQRLYAHKHSKFASLPKSSEMPLHTLSQSDPQLCNHATKVGRLSVAVGRQLSLPESQLERLGRAAELHDIGKIGLPGSILDKPGPLTTQEWEFMRNHTLIGERIISAIPALLHVARIVRSSHERWDGNGYPDRLAGGAIPLDARIIAACDAYDAMTSGRPYQEPIAASEALQEIRRQAGKQFDPSVAQALIDAAAVVNPDLAARSRR
jgi:two-component system cell cycle response regulator